MSNLKQSLYIKKESSLAPEIALKASLIPGRVILPLSQHAGKPSRILVKENQTVKAGEKIADLDGCISANLHASISGVVTKIESYFHPVINLCRAVFISAKGPDGDWPQKKDSEIKNISSDNLVDIIKEAGIVGLGGAAFPTQVKLSPPPDKKIETLIINGCECEPYLASDDLLMQNSYFQILKGIEILDKILNPKRIIIAIESNKQSAIERMRQAVIGRRIEVVKLDVKYPQGAEKQLVDSLLSRQVPPGGLPYDVGVLVQNVATCFAIYEAVYKEKPLIERYVTLAGDCLKNPGVYLLRIGALVSDIAEAAGGFKKEPGKVIFGGPMMGIAQSSLDTPVIKGTSGILFFSKDFTKEHKEYPCIKCARCVDSCPMNLLPVKIAHFVKHKKMDLLQEYNTTDCIECGCCQYLCPSRIPLVDFIKLGKNYLKNKK